MTRRWLALAVLAVALTAGGCAAESASGPPDIEYGRDVCDQCHMIISEARYAAAYRDAEGDPHLFDDIGDMVAHAERAGFGEDDVTAWVHDYLTEEWLEAPTAWFVRSGTFTTPMAGGIVAVASRRDAERLAADEGGDLLRWSEVFSTPARPASGPTEPTTTITTEMEDPP